jgi:hypothetical protein
LDEPPVLESNSEPRTCNCDVKYNKQLSEMREKLEKEHKDDKEKVLDELSERVCKTYSIFYKEIWYRY